MMSEKTRDEIYYGEAAIPSSTDKTLTPSEIYEAGYEQGKAEMERVVEELIKAYRDLPIACNNIPCEGIKCDTQECMDILKDYFINKSKEG
jgi:hypothetical protein